MASRNSKPGSGGFDPSEKVNSNTLKRHPKMDLSRSDLLQLLSYLEGELQGRDIVIATLRAEKAKQLLYQAKYGRFGLGDPFSAMQRDSDNMKDNTFDESAIKSMYDSQLAQLENLIATQRKAQMKMREQMLVGDKRYHKVCSELEDERRKHAQDTAQGDDVTYMLEKERERLKQEVDFEKANAKKMEKDLKKTLVSLEEERANSAKHKQVALMLIKERKKLVEKMVSEKHKADQAERLLNEERNKSMNMAEGLVQESKKSLKMEATMERQLSEFDLEREQMKNKLQREENRTKDLQSQIDALRWQVETLQKQLSGKSPKESLHSVEIKSTVSPPVRSSVERVQAWSSSGSVPSHSLTSKSKPAIDQTSIEHEAGLSPRNSPSELSVRKRDNTRYASPQPVSIDRSGVVQYSDSMETRVGPIGADQQSGHKLNISTPGAGGIVSSGGKISVQTGGLSPHSGPVSPRRVVTVGRGVPPPIPPNKPVLPAATLTKSVATPKVGGLSSKESRVTVTPTAAASGSKPVHIPVSVVHTSSVTSSAGNRTPKREGSPNALRKPAQWLESPTHSQGSLRQPSTESFDFLGPEMEDLQQLLVSMVTDPSDSASVDSESCASSSATAQLSPSSSSSMCTSGTSISQDSSSTPAVDASAVIPACSPSIPAVDASAVVPACSPSIPSVCSASSNPLTAPTSLVFTQLVASNPLITSTTTTMVSARIPIQHDVLKPDTVNSDCNGTLDIKRLPDIPTSPIHRFAAAGSVESLRKLIVDLEADVNLPMKDGTTPAHCAAEHGQEDCLKLLIERGCNVNSLRDDQQSPVHCAAAHGHVGCLTVLMNQGANINFSDHSGRTALHWSSSKGHLKCCKKLLMHGANRITTSNVGWTPLHLAVHSGNVDCLHLLLTFENNQSEDLNKVKQEVMRMSDKDGWSLAHLAAVRESHECLSVILSHCDVDLTMKDRWDRTVLDVCSANCYQLLLPYVTRDRMKHVQVELRCSGSVYQQQQPFVIGHVEMLPVMNWTDVDGVLITLLEEYLDRVDRGVRTKKISRLDPDAANNMSPFSLGLGRDSARSFSIGSLCWNPGGPHADIVPHEVMGNNNNPTITITLKGSEEDYDSLAYDLMLPLSSISNYIRLVDQYKCVVFYGPEGTRKKQLVKRLARHLTDIEKQRVAESRLTQVYLHRDFSHKDFVQLLKSEGCLVPAGWEAERSCVVLLFHLEKVNLAQMLGGLIDHIDDRGQQRTFLLPGQHGEQEMVYFVNNFYLIATMDKTRSTGLDLTLQQRFRWVHFRVGVEPIKNLLARHLLRRLIHSFGGQLPPADDSFFKAVEWLMCVWLRLNDGVGKLGLPDIVFGPDLFMPCPVEEHSAQVVLDWMRTLWNDTISPVVREAVMRGTGKEGIGDGHHKVVSTALYVLMQRVIVPGCPLAAEDKDEYLALFSGSNELDVPLRTDNRYSAGLSPPSQSNTSNRNNGAKSRKQSRHSAEAGNESMLHYHGNSVKRRSHSDSSLSQTDRMEIPVIHHQSGDVPASDVQAKVPKLEMRSPVLGLTVPLPNSFSADGRANTFSSLSRNSESSSNQRRSTFSVQSRSSQPSVSSKRSRSSENLNSVSRLHASRGARSFQPRSPFSFSLTTPTSSLFSFKFMDKSRRSRSATSSPSHFDNEHS